MSSTSKPNYDFGYFKEWCDSCKVRRVQEAYDELSSAAKKHEKSVEERDAGLPQLHDSEGGGSDTSP